MRCAMCGKFKKSEDLSYEVSRRTLWFGMSYGHIFHEYRCKSCEKILIKEIWKTINSVKMRK
jgi:hypothetical protein